MRNLPGLLLLAVLYVPSNEGCVAITQFVGPPQVTGGEQGCRLRCAEEGLEFAGMVSTGEYTDGCVCRDQNASAAETMELATAAAAGASAARVENRERQQDADERALEIEAAAD